MRRMYSENQLINEIKNVKKDITTLVDADGHNRFIEGDINLTPNVPAGITKTYGKWSLSGTHLMLVICGEIENATVISGGTVLCEIELPSWVFDKITPLYGDNLDYHNTPIFNAAGQTQTMGNYLRKASSVIEIRMSGITLSDTRSFRFNFDLLSDNDEDIRL